MAITKLENRKVRSGNRILIEFGGQEIGLIQELRASDDYSPEPASGVGDIHVQEYVPTMARHQLQVSQAILFKESLRSAGVSLENGDDALKGLVFDITIYDKDAGAEPTAGSYLRKYVNCSISSCDTEVRKHAILMNNASILALDCKGTSI